jgi:hypothetical protein
METKLEIGGLLQRAMTGDAKASLEILNLQRQGRALRLYPNGRKGPLDEGVTPIVFGRSSETGLIRIEMLKPGPITFPRKDLAEMMGLHLHLCGLIWIDHCESEDPAAAMEADVDKDLIHRTWFTENNKTIGLMFEPSRDVVEYGISMTRRIFNHWIAFIDESDLDLCEFGFELDSQFDDVLDFLGPVDG